MSDVRIDSAAPVEATERWTPREGSGGDPTGTAFCRIRGTIEKEIAFELWLPTADQWNRRFLAAGVGGEAGQFNYADMVRGIRRGYATASTDTGHRLGDKDWALGRPDRRTNFAARANHLLAVKSKALIKAFYNKPPAKSYFVGCSGGGREGLKEMQAYPADFDGILAGGAGPDQLAASMRLLWSQYVMAPKFGALVTGGTWDLVSKTAIKACDDQDGVIDGVITNPLECRFDPAILSCKPGHAGECLDAAQLEVVKTIFDPLRNEFGEPIDSGVLPGVRMTFEPRSAFAYSLFGKVVHGDPNWDASTVKIARDMSAARNLWPDLPNDKADVSVFRKRGGKMLYYHGWMDPFILAQGPIAYHRKVGEALGGTDDFFRLFMVPGMGHCRGGPGTDVFGGAGADGIALDARHDMLSALEQWVEQGRAPDEIVAAKLDGKQVVRTRPLCPFPATAVYRGTGSTDAAASFQCLK